MTIRTSILVLALLSLFSCSKKEHFEKHIIGEWKFARSIYKEEKRPVEKFWMNGVSGYVFYNDGHCENKQAYIRRNKDKEMVYYGNETKYKIENDSLKIYNLSDSIWNSRKIISIEEDTLTLGSEDVIFKYCRSEYVLDPAETYDKIIVSSSGCLGYCPISTTSIDKNGDVLFWGQMYNTQNGLYKSRITREKYREVETAFKKAGISNLKDRYSAEWTDDEALTVTFLKDNKIVKTVNDYGGQAPAEFMWAYTQLRYLYQTLELVPLTIEQSYLTIAFAHFETEQKTCPLDNSECFHLMAELLKGKESVMPFEHKYLIEYWTHQDKRTFVYTDGRFYKFEKKTIDLGYNFLTENDMMPRFRPIRP